MIQGLDKILNKIGEWKESTKNPDEIVVKVCPFCKPDKKEDLNTFKINKDTGLFKCHRQNRCNISGNIHKLNRYVLKKEYNPGKEKQIKIKKTTDLFTKQATEYMKNRMISMETVRACKVMMDQSGKNFVFNHYEDGELISQKFRGVSEKSFFTAGDTKKMSLWRFNDLDLDQEIIITEGEIDALTVYESGFKNVASLPMGSENSDWIENSYDNLEKIKSIIFWPDNDKAGMKARNNIIERLGIHKVRFVNTIYKDANEAIKAEGKEYIAEMLVNAKREQIPDFIQSHKITDTIDWKDCEKLRTVHPEFDHLLGGGLPMFGYSVLSGFRGSGKTSFANNMLISAVNQGYRSMYYSGEILPQLVIPQLQKIVGGTRNLENGYVNQKIINEWQCNTGKMIMINTSRAIYDSNEMLRKIVDMIKMYGIRFFMIDNLMKIRFSGRSFSEQLEKQEDFCIALDDIANKYKVHIVIVQHPKKIDGRKMTTDDIRGNGRIPDAACNVFIVHRMDEKFKRQNADYAHYQETALISLEKNRFGGNIFEYPMFFSAETTRFYRSDVENERERLFRA